MEVLTNLKPGEWAKVTGIYGGRGARHNLSLRGIQEGDIIRMVSSSGGPVVVEVNRSIIALGRGIARRIITQRINKRESA